MFTLNVVTPEKKLVTEIEIDEVLVPAYRGQLDILPGHAPLMTTLSAGVLKYRPKGSSKLETVVVAWGYCEVHPEGVIVLAQTAESLEELDRARVEATLKEMKTKMLEPFLQADQVEMFQRKMQVEEARLEALGLHTSH